MNRRQGLDGPGRPGPRVRTGGAATPQRYMSYAAAIVVLAATSCKVGSTPDRLVGITELDGRVVNVGIRWAPTRAGGATYGGSVGVTVRSSATGQRLGRACPRLNARLTIETVEIPLVDGGGASQCSALESDPDCGVLCTSAVWSGNIGSLLANSPRSLDIAFSDDSGTIAGSVLDPMPRAQFNFVGFVAGQSVAEDDVLNFQLLPESPLSAAQINSGRQTSLPVTIAVQILRDSANWPLDPGPISAQPGTGDLWYFSLTFQAGMQAPTAGPAFLSLALLSDLILQPNDPLTAWTVYSNIHQVDLPLEYQP